MRIHPASGLLVLLLLGCANYGANQPEALLEQVRSQGGHAVVNELWEDRERWDHVMEGIASGSKEWLDVAVAIFPGTNAGATSELNTALFLALGPAPRRMLALMHRLEGGSDTGLAFEFGPANVCGRGSPYIDYQPDEARRLIRDRITAVAGVRDAELVATRDACVRGLKSDLALDIHE